MGSKKSFSDCFKLALVNEQYYRVLARRAINTDRGLAVLAILLLFAVISLMDHTWPFIGTFLFLLITLAVKTQRQQNIDNFQGLAKLWTTLVGLVRKSASTDSAIHRIVVHSIIADAETFDTTPRDKKLEGKISTEVDKYWGSRIQ
jgi:hypothetical protein